MISIIIPTRDEAANLAVLLPRLTAEAEPHEVIVADGGSTDGTTALARSAGVRLVHSEPGRGMQLGAGADLAKGDVFLFLHADSTFPAGGLAALQRALAESPGAVGGNFRLVFDGDDGFSRWLTGFHAWLRRRGLFYGDSGIFVRRAAYGEIGGMRPMALMEDFEFVRRLRRLGATLCLTAPALTTSSRRFTGRKPLAIVGGWLQIHALYLLGVPSHRLARIYDAAQRRAISAVTAAYAERR